ncbi:MORN repeat-containing protein [Paenibacillus hamazuiensis]|uniref:MORN repeat-containing protein n=1 Tax=Paenibacillus hamazuiensis TaxID=2936508 RepID=UPI00200CC1FE|nr:hypothetical protein [Paenibacillus hamazuiensis]
MENGIATQTPEAGSQTARSAAAPKAAELLGKLLASALEALKQAAAAAGRLLFPKQLTLADYIPIGRYYVSKRLLALIVLLLALIVVFGFIHRPVWLNKWLRLPTPIYEKAGKPVDFTGLVKLFDSRKSLFYFGDMTDGQYDGQGKLYDAKDQLIYEGQFAKGVKQGAGVEYDGKGNPVYRGAFESGAYAGEGTLYYPVTSEAPNTVQYRGTFQGGKPASGTELYPNGKVKYAGTFSDGLYNGTGVLFNPDGGKTYEGGFASGQFSGEGVAYYPNGAVKYKGSFLMGVYDGNGKAFRQDGTAQYEGTFRSGVYAGDGTLFDTSGKVVYKGQFVAGLYGGEGSLFDDQGMLRYTGTFAAGRYNGLGKLLESGGSPVYEGKFKDGLYDGLGTLFDKDGHPNFKGYFKNGLVYYPGFLGLPRSKLEEVLGKATEAAALTDGHADEPAGISPDSLTNVRLSMKYNDNGMTFLLNISEANPLENNVSAVQIWGSRLMQQLLGDLESAAAKKDKSGNADEPIPKLKEKMPDGTAVTTYLWDGYLYKCYFRPVDRKLTLIEVTSS